MFGIAAILIATLSIADFYTRDLPEAAGGGGDQKKGGGAGSQAGGNGSGNGARAGGGPISYAEQRDDDAMIPKSAEELGLVPQYGQDGSRFV